MIIAASILKGKVTAPPSKSIAHRAIISAALAQGRSIISNIELSDDIISTLEAIKKLGAEVGMKLDENGRVILNISGISGQSNENLPYIEAGESGSTLRFMMPIVLALCNGGIFDGEGRLPQRPLDEYKRIFKEQGISWQTQSESHNLPVKAEGKLKSGDYEISGSVSSQYISGLMFALALLEGDSKIKVTDNLESAKYVDMTIEVLKIFGIVVEKNGGIFEIRGEQKYKAANIEVEGDWSQSAYLLLAGILGDGMIIEKMNIDTNQGDNAIVEVLRKMGADIDITENSIIAHA